MTDLTENAMPKVSVVIITYNHEDFIADAIEGALRQETSFPYEIIIGEDESEDGTREICIDYAERYPDKIRLFLRSREDVIYVNGRPTGRFNAVESMKAARGKYIALCEGDDYWTDPHKLQKQVDFLEAHPQWALCRAGRESAGVKALSTDMGLRLACSVTASVCELHGGRHSAGRACPHRGGA